MPTLSEKWHDLIWSYIGSKFNLHYTQEISIGFMMGVLTTKFSIGSSVITKFQHKQTIFIFWTKFSPKWYLQSKTD